MENEVDGVHHGIVAWLRSLFSGHWPGREKAGALGIELRYAPIDGWPGMCKLVRNPMGPYAGEIDIPASAWVVKQEAKVVKIADDAFVGSPITSLALPETLTGVYMSLEGCTLLTHINVSPRHKAFSSLDGVLFDKEQRTLLLFPPGRGGDYHVPDGVEVIADGAFRDCAELHNIALPTTLTRVEQDAFAGCRLHKASFHGPADSLNIKKGNDALKQGLGIR